MVAGNLIWTLQKPPNCAGVRNWKKEIRSRTSVRNALKETFSGWCGLEMYGIKEGAVCTEVSDLWYISETLRSCGIGYAKTELNACWWNQGKNDTTDRWSSILQCLCFVEAFHSPWSVKSRVRRRLKTPQEMCLLPIHSGFTFSILPSCNIQVGCFLIWPGWWSHQGHRKPWAALYKHGINLKGRVRFALEIKTPIYWAALVKFLSLICPSVFLTFCSRI